MLVYCFLWLICSVRCSVSGGNGSTGKRTTLHDLYEKEGQSPWYDNLCRPVTDLLPLIARGVRGVTSNPAVYLSSLCVWVYFIDSVLFHLSLLYKPLQIFQKAISTSNAYNDQFRYSFAIWMHILLLSSTLVFLSWLLCSFVSFCSLDFGWIHY